MFFLFFPSKCILPHAAKLQSDDGTFQSCCKAPKSHAMPCDAFSQQCHVGNFAPDIGISDLFIPRFSSSFRHNDGHLVSVLVI